MADWINCQQFGSLGKHAWDEEYSDSGYSSHGMYGSQNRIPEFPFLDFLKTLWYCYPLTSGFHTISPMY
jgi:hypothetical protein